MNICCILDAGLCLSNREKFNCGEKLFIYITSKEEECLGTRCSSCLTVSNEVTSTDLFSVSTMSSIALKNDLIVYLFYCLVYLCGGAAPDDKETKVSD